MSVEQLRTPNSRQAGNEVELHCEHQNLKVDNGLCNIHDVKLRTNTRSADTDVYKHNAQLAQEAVVAL